MLLVALSATMRNVQDIRDWFVAVHGPTGHALLFFFNRYTAGLWFVAVDGLTGDALLLFIYIYVYIALLCGAEVAIEGEKEKKNGADLVTSDYRPVSPVAF